MPPRVEAALHVVICAVLIWVAIDYANYAVGNIRAGLWIGAAVDTAIWLGTVALFVWSAREIERKWDE